MILVLGLHGHHHPAVARGDDFLLQKILFRYAFEDRGEPFPQRVRGRDHFLTNAPKLLARGIEKVPIFIDALGDVVFDKSPTVGMSSIWPCTGTTDGVPTDVAGDTTSGSATVEGVADTTDFVVGEYVTVSAGFATTGQYLLLAKTATTLKIDSPATSSQANITVTQQVPVFANIYSVDGTPVAGNVIKWNAGGYAYWVAP